MGLINKANDNFNVTYQSIEIGSYHQRYSDGSESAMKLLCNYITPKMTFDAFRCNLTKLVNFCSYEVSEDSNNVYISRIRAIEGLKK